LQFLILLFFSEQGERERDGELVAGWAVAESTGLKPELAAQDLWD
jgi:hypothetical protein